MENEDLLELMIDYLNQYGTMRSFLQYCEDDCDRNKQEIEYAIENFQYGDL